MRLPWDSLDYFPIPAMIIGMAINDDILKNYIGRVLDLKNRKDITAEDLQNIALEVGITRADLEEIEKTMHNHLVRGRNYLLHKCRDDAIEEFENALALSPLNAGILYELAEAYYERGTAEKIKKDLEKAESLVKECIQYSPSHNEAYTLLQKINMPQNHTGRGSGRVRFPALITIITLTLFCCGFLAFYLLILPAKQEPPQPAREDISIETDSSVPESIPDKESPEAAVPVEKIPDKESPDSSVPESISDKESPEAAVPAEKIPEQEGRRNLPVTLLKDDQTAHFTFAVRESVISPFKDSFSFLLKADIVPADIAINELSLRAALIDRSGVERYAEIKAILSNYQPAILPGNTLPADILMYYKEKEPGITGVKVSVSFIRQEPYTATDIHYPAKELIWLVPKPAGVALSAVERLNSLSGGFNVSYHRLTFEITNNSSRSLEVLKLRVDWQGKDGASFAAIDTYVTSTQDSTFLPGQTRIGFVIGSFREEKPDANGYTLNVVEIR